MPRSESPSSAATNRSFTAAAEPSSHLPLRRFNAPGRLAGGIRRRKLQRRYRAGPWRTSLAESRSSSTAVNPSSMAGRCSSPQAEHTPLLTSSGSSLEEVSPLRPTVKLPLVTTPSATTSSPGSEYTKNTHDDPDQLLIDHGNSKRRLKFVPKWVDGVREDASSDSWEDVSDDSFPSRKNKQSSWLKSGSKRAHSPKHRTKASLSPPQ